MGTHGRREPIPCAGGLREGVVLEMFLEGVHNLKLISSYFYSVPAGMTIYDAVGSEVGGWRGWGLSEASSSHQR